MTEKKLKVIFFGDSHAKYFDKIPRVFRANSAYAGIEITGDISHGATVTGLGKRASTLGLHVNIMDRIDSGSHVVLNFGQVDLELGLYYRMVVKGLDLDPFDFARSLVENYCQFIEKVKQKSYSVLIKGNNLTVLKSDDFGISYVSRIISENVSDEIEKERTRGVLLKKYHKLFLRNKITIFFNKLLEERCTQIGSGYFDINSFIAAPGFYYGFDLEKGVHDQFISAGFDHHLTDSIAIRKIHYDGILNHLRANGNVDSGAL